MILDRMEGKPAQTVNVEGVPTVPLFALPAGAIPDCGSAERGK